MIKDKESRWKIGQAALHSKQNNIWNSGCKDKMLETRAYCRSRNFCA